MLRNYAQLGEPRNIDEKSSCICCRITGIRATPTTADRADDTALANGVVVSWKIRFSTTRAATSRSWLA
jgi:hypothetical protein